MDPNCLLLGSLQTLAVLTFISPTLVSFWFNVGISLFCIVYESYDDVDIYNSPGNDCDFVETWNIFYLGNCVSRVDE